MSSVLLVSMVLCCCSSSTRLTIQPFPGAEAGLSAMEYGSYWAAMEGFDFKAAEGLAPTAEEQWFAGSLSDVVNNRFEKAEPALRSLHTQASNALLQERTGKVLAECLFAESRWSDVLKVQSAASPASDESVLPRAFATLPKEEIVFPSKDVTLPIGISSSGTPTVEVTANGRRMTMWIDTGAKISVLASDIAELVGAGPIVDATQQAGTATSKKIDVHPTALAELRIGELVIRNHPAIIIRKEDLEFKLFGLIPLMKIDGIIGWDIIRRLDMTIDYKQKMLTLREPVERRQDGRNLFWFGCPIVRLRTEDGIPVNFALDTGAKSTTIRPPILSKINPVGVDTVVRRVGSAGGWETVKSEVLPHLSLVVDNVMLRFSDIPAHTAEDTIFGRLDGQLGSDIAKEGIMHIDFSAGRFSVVADTAREVE